MIIVVKEGPRFPFFIYTQIGLRNNGGHFNIYLC